MPTISSGDLPDGLFFDSPVQPPWQKYFAFSETRISRIVRAVPPRQEGRIAIVTDAGWDAVDVSELQRAIRAQTNNSDADGKAVWSWRSEAGAKSAMMPRITPMTVATKRWSPGRARNKLLKPLRREGRMIPAPPVVHAACYLCCTRAAEIGRAHV
jgi:hypothetical protein